MAAARMMGGDEEREGEEEGEEKGSGEVMVQTSDFRLQGRRPEFKIGCCRLWKEYENELTENFDKTLTEPVGNP
jgi:hypothetical protein